MREDLLRSLELLCQRGLFAFVWLDPELVVLERYGALADWVLVGEAIESAVPPLLGFEDSIRALRRSPHRTVSLANIGIRYGDRELPKLNMQVFWQGDRHRYLVVLTREVSQSELEIELRREIQRRRHDEREMALVIERTNEELNRANRDLAEFAYVISHDLKAPLRALRITAELIEREHAANLRPEAREALQRIRLLARRMSAMMSGLLEYSRIGRKKDALTSVDTQRLLKEIIETIGVPAGMRIEREGNWPTFETVAEPLDVVLRNLIENAIKHHDTKQGTLRLLAEEQSECWRFSIADDGPGIDPGYQTAIFEPFRKIDQDASPESSGIGLALVKKTVELVGGSIEVQSDPAVKRGTTFIVLWPKAIADG
jgi:signal transduction histidine kinase